MTGHLPTLLTLMALLPALAACPGPRQRVEPRDLERCPAALTDEVLEDVRSYLDCPLPQPVARLLRTDYADDELELPDWSALRRYEGRVPREVVARQLDELICPGGRLLPWIDLDPATGLLRPDPVLAPDLALALPAASPPLPPGLAGRLPPPLEAIRPFRADRQAALRASVDPGHPVGRLRVAVDPGHQGGELALFESRELTWTGADGKAYTIREGDLTLRTALELARKLEARGVEVVLTREAPGSARGLRLARLRPFADRLLRHLAQDPQFRLLDERLSPLERRRLRVAVALHAVRKQHGFEALRDRIRRAGERAPDLLVSIHYNASGHPVGTAYPQGLLAMVKGNVEAHRLYNPYYRFRALRDAFEVDELNASAHAAAACLRQMSRTLGLPIVGENRYADHRPILRLDGSLSGVDAWNGVLFRYVDYPAFLAEGPHMDERDEIPRLDAAMRAPLHQPGTRTERYAEGLAAGILEWAGRWLAQERNDFGPDL